MGIGTPLQSFYPNLMNRTDQAISKAVWAKCGIMQSYYY